ncbi:MAG: YceD family protein [Pyrinomonadaceae bacterium]
MIIDLITLKNSPFHFSFSISPEEIELDSDEAKLKNAVSIEGDLTKRIVQTDVEGEINADVEIECTRCLQAADANLKIPFSVSYIEPENYTEEKESELGASDLQISVFGGEKIDVNELVREQILLNLPGQIFCQEDCKGLCRKCGANRNLIDCNCEENEVDPRWSALKDFR